MQWRLKQIPHISRASAVLMLQSSPHEQTYTHTFWKTPDIKDHKNKVQHIPWMFSDTLSQATESTYYFIWISPSVFSHRYHARFRSFFNLPQSQIHASMVSLAQRSAVPSAWQECKYSALLLIMDLELWSYYCFTVKSELRAGNSTMSMQKTKEKANSYFIIATSKTSVFQENQSSIQIQSSKCW